MTLHKCHACQLEMTKDNSRYVAKVKVGRETFLTIECGRCFYVNKIKENV